MKPVSSESKKKEETTTTPQPHLMLHKTIVRCRQRPHSSTSTSRCRISSPPVPCITNPPSTMDVYVPCCICPPSTSNTNVSHNFACICHYSISRLSHSRMENHPPPAPFAGFWDNAVYHNLLQMLGEVPRMRHLIVQQIQSLSQL